MWVTTARYGKDAMKKIALWLFRAAAVMGALGWLVLFLFGADCLFFLEPDHSRTHCFAVSLYLYQLLLLPATVLSLVSFVWLTGRQQNATLFFIIAPFLFVKLQLF